MPDTEAQSSGQFTMVCVRCERPVTVRLTWVGMEVKCPHCSSVLRVPAASGGDQPVRAGAPSLRASRVFNFGCLQCRSLLEAHTGMCGQPGQCPTCGARFTIPQLDPRTGMPLEPGAIEDDGQDPTPLHAYGASGHQAPRIVRASDGSQAIECPRCSAHCPVDANNCPACSVPFTIEGAPTLDTAQRDSRAVAALVLGVVAIPVCILFVPGILAVVFGLLSLRNALATDRVPKMAVAGLILGLVSLLMGAAVVLL